MAGCILFYTHLADGGYSGTFPEEVARAAQKGPTCSMHTAGARAQTYCATPTALPYFCSQLAMWPKGGSTEAQSKRDMSKDSNLV